MFPGLAVVGIARRRAEQSAEVAVPEGGALAGARRAGGDHVDRAPLGGVAEERFAHERGDVGARDVARQPRSSTSSTSITTLRPPSLSVSLPGGGSCMRSRHDEVLLGLPLPQQDLPAVAVGLLADRVQEVLRLRAAHRAADDDGPRRRLRRRSPSGPPSDLRRAARPKRNWPLALDERDQLEEEHLAIERLDLQPPTSRCQRVAFFSRAPRRTPTPSR